MDMNMDMDMDMDIGRGHAWSGMDTDMHGDMDMDRPDQLWSPSGCGQSMLGMAMRHRYS